MKRYILIGTLSLSLILPTTSHAFWEEVFAICEAALEAREFIPQVIGQMSGTAGRSNDDNSREFAPRTTLTLTSQEDSAFIISLKFDENKRELEEQEIEFEKLLKSAHLLLSMKASTSAAQEFLRTWQKTASGFAKSGETRRYDISTSCFKQLEGLWKTIETNILKGLSEKRVSTRELPETKKAGLLERMKTYVKEEPPSEITRSSSSISPRSFGLSSLKSKRAKKTSPALSARRPRHPEEAASGSQSSRERKRNPIRIGSQRAKSQDELRPSTFDFSDLSNRPSSSRNHQRTFDWGKPPEVF